LRKEIGIWIGFELHTSCTQSSFKPSVLNWISAIHQSAKLYIGCWVIYHDMVLNTGCHFRTPYQMKNIRVIAYINHMKLLKVSLGS